MPTQPRFEKPVGPEADAHRAGFRNPGEPSLPHPGPSSAGPMSAATGWGHPGSGPANAGYQNPGYQNTGFQNPGYTNPTEQNPGSANPAGHPQHSAWGQGPTLPSGHGPQGGYGGPGGGPAPYANPAPYGAGAPYANPSPYGGGYGPAGAAPGFVPTASGYAPYAPMQQAPRPGVMQLRPQGVGDILDVAMKVIRGNPGGSLGSAVLGGLLGALLGAICFVIAIRTGGDDGDLSGVGVGVLLVGSVLSGLSFVAPAGALVHVFGQAVMGRRASAMAALRVGLRRIVPMLGLALLLMVGVTAVIAIVFGVMFGIGGDQTPGLLVALAILLVGVGLTFVSVRASFSGHIIVLEKAGPITALKRSWALTRKRFWRTFGVLLLAQIVVSIISYIVQFILSILVMMIFGFAILGAQDGGSGTIGIGAAIGVGILAVCLSLLMMALVYPFLSNVLGALYVDARMRDEGLATQLMQLPMQQGLGVSLTKGDLDFPRPVAAPRQGGTGPEPMRHS